MTMKFDALIFTDPRFSGGTSAAVAADVRALSDAGLNVGLALVESVGFFQDFDTENDTILQLSDLPGVTQ
ncbi:MAG: glycosyltransferase family 1 protein, partial [Alphaproteobacteria bacterium]|nr:glycosyltransferase family 1 protein [Alphaproteobacteria bacterium]